MKAKMSCIGNFRRYTQENGPTLSTATLPVIEHEGLLFKDHARTGALLPYEDWRLSADERAKDLASRLSTEEIAGLMMYSGHQIVPGIGFGHFQFTYDGKAFTESGKKPWELADQQKKFLSEDHLRHVLLMRVESTDIAARWSNELQAYTEQLPFAIPVNLSSDPRHGAGSASAEFKSQAGSVSKWPEGLGMAATFSPETCKRFGEVVSKELRAMGIATALFPQVDLGTEPRWMRVEDTFGSSPELVTVMSKAYCDGLQTTENTDNGWGRDSVSAMVKHWPGGAPCEAGRDAHYAYGAYAVYPGNSFNEHLKPFIDGTFRLDGPTKCASSVMPYYSVSWQIDQTEKKNVGNSYSKYIINDLLRTKYGFDGVVCTDWGITADPLPEMDSFGSRCFGMENLTEAERHLRIIEIGVDQFGGNSDVKPVMEAYRLGCEKYGEGKMRARMEQSAVRLLRNFFRCGLFEDPFLDPEESNAIVGNETFQKEAFDAQLHSIVMLKNNNVLPTSGKLKVYIPGRHIEARKTFFRDYAPAHDLPGFSDKIVNQYYEVVNDANEADMALITIESPLTDGGYTAEERERTGNGYLPITLQYRPYTASTARSQSIAGGDFREQTANRSYKGKTTTAANESDLDLVINTKRVMGDKPVIVCIRMHNPSVLAELEPYADAILVDFGVQQEALLTVITGAFNPSGKLPVQLPANMETVEAHCEDKPMDMIPYTDSNGNTYDFGYGLSYK